MIIIKPGTLEKYRRDFKHVFVIDLTLIELFFCVCIHSSGAFVVQFINEYDRYIFRSDTRKIIHQRLQDG
jgi:hypothetical protein